MDGPLRLTGCSTLQMCAIMNDEDRTVAASVTPCLRDIARAIDSVLPRVLRVKSEAEAAITQYSPETEPALWLHD